MPDKNPTYPSSDGRRTPGLVESQQRSGTSLEVQLVQRVDRNTSEVAELEDRPTFAHRSENNYNKIIIIIIIISLMTVWWNVNYSVHDNNIDKRNFCDQLTMNFFAHLHHAAAVQRYHVRWHICVNSWARHSVLMTLQGQRTPLSFSLSVCVRFPFRSIFSLLI